MAAVLTVRYRELLLLILAEDREAGAALSELSAGGSSGKLFGSLSLAGCGSLGALGAAGAAGRFGKTGFAGSTGLTGCAGWTG